MLCTAIRKHIMSGCLFYFLVLVATDDNYLYSFIHFIHSFALSHLILTIPLQGNCCFIWEEMEVQKGKVTFPGSHN